MTRLLLLAAVAVVALVLFAGGGAAYALSLENHDNFCASCHTQPEETFVTRAVHTPPTDLASAHATKGVQCIACHSGPPPLGRVNGLTQGAQDYAAYMSGRYAKPAVTTHPLPDVNCTQCHANLFTNKTLKNHYHFYLPDWQVKAPAEAAKCISCHTAHTQGNSVTVKYAFDAKVNPYCAACHTFEGIR
jgi:predicted CXXCH cytochrome family protein